MPVDQIPEPQVAEVEVPVFKEVTVVEEVEVVEGISVVEVPAVTTAPGVEVPEPPVPVVLAGVLLDSVVQTATTAPGVEVPEPPVPEDLAGVALDTAPSGVLPVDPSTNMPPPSTPHVKLIPPTPATSQEEANGPTTLLEVPAPVSTPATRSRSRSRSPAPEVLRRSPRLGSPVPPQKRKPSDPLDNPPSKKRRED